METCNFTDYLEIVEAQEECASTSLQASETDLHCDPTFTEKIKKENSSPFSPDYLDTAEAQKECASTSLQASETDLHCDPTFTGKIKKENSSPSSLRLKLKRKKSSKSLIQQHPTSETYTVSEPNIYEQTRERLTPLKFMKRVAFILCLGMRDGGGELCTVQWVNSKVAGEGWGTVFLCFPYWSFFLTTT